MLRFALNTDTHIPNFSASLSAFVSVSSLFSDENGCSGYFALDLFPARHFETATYVAFKMYAPRYQFSVSLLFCRISSAV